MIAGVVLAAGASRRLGRIKQLLLLDGQPLLDWPLQAMRAFAPDVLVLVLGHAASQIGAAIDLSGVTLVLNPLYEQGLSTSLQAALKALPEQVECAVVVTGDQPFVTPAHLSGLLEQFQGGKPVVATAYSEFTGVPAAIAREVWPLMAQIEGDQGLRPLLRGRPDLVSTVAAPDSFLALDVDTEESYQQVVAAVAGWKHAPGLCPETP